MKKKIQRYLSGEREGFSLIELIIVIAIMAILIGVIALAVIPNIQKSKISKDLATLDAVCSALNSAVATTQAKGSGSFSFTTTKKSPASSEADKVLNATIDALGSGSSTLGSVDDVTIECKYDVPGKVIKVYAKPGASYSGSKNADGVATVDGTTLEVTN